MQHDQIISTLLASKPHEWITSIRGNVMTNYYKQDTDLRLEYGFEEEDVHERNFLAPWANGFSNPNASSYYVQLMYRSTVILQLIAVYVDGGLVMMPLPHGGSKNVDQISYRVAQILDGGAGLLDQYMQQAGMTILP